MKYYLYQFIQFLFWFQVITAFLGSAFFHIIQKIRFRYKHALPTCFHCTLLKISMLFFFIPHTTILYLSVYMYYLNTSLQNNTLIEFHYSFFLFQILTLAIRIIGTLNKGFHYIKRLKQLNQYVSCASLKITEPAVMNLSSSIQKRYGMKKILPVYMHPYIPSPAATGILKPKILLPKNILQEASQETLQIILSHEILHYKKKDIFWYYFSAILQCIYWYLPLIKTLCTETKNWLEYQCDECCCNENKKHYSKQEYFNTILHLLHQEKDNNNNHYTLEANFYQSEHQVEKRILHMHSKKEITEVNSLFCFLILIVLLCAYFISLILSFVISFHLF